MFTKHLMYGAAYYPEHWEKKHWARDIQLMKKAGFNIVRLAEFAWCFFEPAEGRFEWDWLDEPMDMLQKAGIDVILGTPTATIPAWMAKNYPDVLALDLQGRRRRFGVRKDYCVNHPDFQRLGLRVVEQIAKRYGRDSRVLGFQTDNEFGGSPCRCGICLDKFRAFLQRKYKTIDQLNDEYGTWFWGTKYTCFDQIDWPPGAANPSLDLDARRFFSQVDVDFQAQQIEILRAHSKKPITHNCMGIYSNINYYDLSEDLDFVSWDSYPGSNTGKKFGLDALAAAVTWSLKNHNFLIMEQQSGPGGWDAYNPGIAPGEMTMLAWQSVARGADGISYFRWRTSVSGQEQYWHGILNHDNVPRRRYFEVAEMGKKIHAVSDQIIGTQPAQQVGLLNNYDQIWSTEIQRQNGDNPVHFRQIFRDLANVMAPLAVDFGVFGAHHDLDRYKLLVCPPLYLGDAKFARKLEAFVRGGGHVVLMARSGVKTVNNKNVLLPLPGVFQKLAGVEIDEYATIPKDAKWEVELAGGQHIAAARMREHLLPAKGTEVIGVHRGDYMDGLPAITRRTVGKGGVWYLGTLPGVDDLRTLFKIILPQTGVSLRTDLPAGVEVVHREGKGKQLTFVLNHTNAPQTVNITGSARDLLTNKNVNGQIALRGYGVAILDRRV